MINTKQRKSTEPIFISRRELSHRLDISQSTAQRLEKANVIRGLRVGGSIRYKWDDVIASLQSQSKNSY